MKVLFSLSLLVAFLSNGLGQITQLQQCQKAISESPGSLLSSDVCSTIIALLSPDEHIDVVTDEGEVITDSAGRIRSHSLPPRITSALLLQSIRRTIEEDAQLAQDSRQDADTGMARAMLPSLREHWTESRDTYCAYHPGDSYLDLSDKERLCPAPSTNKAMAPDHSGFTLPIRDPMLTNSSANHQARALNDVTSGACQKAITFAQAEGRLLIYRLPDLSFKWLDKFQKKYGNICFPQYRGELATENYLVVLSSSASTFDGLQPIFRTSTTTMPVSGSGTVTSSNGSTWGYTYQGTMTATTTTEASLPYSDTVTAFYANAYNQSGMLVGSSERRRSAREGGDPAGAAGYNITSALLSIHLKEHLVESILRQIAALP